MTYFDIFSTSFLFSISIIVILIGAIFAYVSYRMGEQDHKLNSMIGVISTMAEETHFFRSKLTLLQQKLDSKDDDHEEEGGSHIINIAENINDKYLISVTDDEDEDESCSDSDSDSETESSEYDEEPATIKTIHLEHPIELDSNTIDLNSDNHLDEDIHLESHIDLDSHNHLNTHIDLDSHIHLEDTVDLDNNDLNLTNDMSFLKNVSIDDLEHNHDHDHDHSKADYKKLSLNKLREVAVNKGVVADASKLKKNEILKLLGDE